MKFNLRANLHRRVCDLILVLGLLVAYVVLAGIRISPSNYLFRSKRREIDWTLFRIERAKSNNTGHLRKQQQDKRAMPVSNESIIIPSLESLEAEFSSRLDVPRKSYQPVPMPVADQAGRQIQFAQHKKTTTKSVISYQQPQYAALMDVPLPDVGQVPEINVDMPENLPTDAPGYRFSEKLNFKDLSDRKEIPQPEVITIELRPDEINENEKDLSPIIHELIQWMQLNPVSFSSVFKRFLHYEKGNLTSQTRFRIDGREYELYLLCKINILEVRICLIEGNNLTLLIDSGLKERSNYLRLGTIKRGDDGSIVSFISQQKRPSLKITDEFYKIFLSWWDGVKETVLN